PSVIDQIKAQLERMVPVHGVTDLTVMGAHLERELALVKVASTGEKRVEALRLAELMQARVVDVTLESFVFEIANQSEQIDAFIEIMRPLGLVEVARTGVAAVLRGPGALE
ncbi:MAG: acetolactate synthase small subunit, partial [Pseudomonadota bacterium]